MYDLFLIEPAWRPWEAVLSTQPVLLGLGDGLKPGIFYSCCMFWVLITRHVLHQSSLSMLPPGQDVIPSCEQQLHGLQPRRKEDLHGQM